MKPIVPADKPKFRPRPGMVVAWHLDGSAHIMRTYWSTMCGLRPSERVWAASEIKLCSRCRDAR